MNKMRQDIPPMIYIKDALGQMESLGLKAPTVATMIEWIREYNLGHKIGGEWVLIEEKFHAFLKGELQKETKNAPE